MRASKKPFGGRVGGICTRRSADDLVHDGPNRHRANDDGKATVDNCIS